jgi:hypothetical protein
LALGFARMADAAQALTYYEAQAQKFGSNKVVSGLGDEAQLTRRPYRGAPRGFLVLEGTVVLSLFSSEPISTDFIKGMLQQVLARLPAA